MKSIRWKLLLLGSALFAGGTTASSAAGLFGPAAPNSWYPCLSYSLPCGKIATRKPENKVLEGALAGDPARGKTAATERNKGNCLACHRLADGDQPGTRGPDLSKYGALGRSDAETYAMIYDMRTRNPDTVMPPMGTNAILSDQEIRDVVAYLQASK